MALAKKNKAQTLWQNEADTGNENGPAHQWQSLCKRLHMDWIQVVGLFGGICTASSLLPQLIKTIKEKKAEDVSKLMLFVLLTGVATWIVYGILRKDLPIIVTNAFSLLLNIVMIVMRFKYSRKGK